MSTHTPGPWALSPYSSIVGIAISGGGFVIAGVRADRPTAEANARLIAAAPDLLALAHQFASECGECGGRGHTLVGHHDRPDETVPCEACAYIWKVIDTAEGRA